jgi:hypothetical protein
MEGPFLDPDVPDGERVAYRGLVGGDEAGRGEVVTSRVAEGRRQLYRQSVVARVAGRAEVRSTTLFRRRSGQIYAESHEIEVLDGSAEPSSTERARFRGVKVLHWGGELESYPRDLAPLLGCALALRGLDFSRGARRGLSVWLAASVYWEVETRVEKEEKVDLPVGNLAAWRVRLRPSFEQVDKALDSLMDALMPPVVAHLEAEPPHRFLRVQFPTGPFKWNPPGVIEATRL